MNVYETTEELVDDHLVWVAAIVRGEPLVGDVAAVAARVQATRRAGIELPLLLLEQRLGLTESEMRVLWVLLAHELDPDVRRMVRERCTEQVSDVSFDVLRRIVYGPCARLRTWRELGPEGQLRTLGLIERTDGTGQAPEQRHTFKVARRVLALAHGDLSIDSELTGIAGVVRSAPPLGELEVEPRVIDEVRRAVDRGGLVIVHGRVGSGRRSTLSAVVARPTLVVDARAISTKREQAQRELRMVAREARLLGCVPLIQQLDALAGGPDSSDRFGVVATELSGLVLATTTRPIRRRWEHPVVQVEIPPLSGTACARLWRRALSEASTSDAEQLATMYPLSPALICAAARASEAACGGGTMRPEHIEAGVRSILDDRLSGLATRVAVTQAWEDLVLPEDQVSAIVELLARIRERRRVYEDWGFGAKLGRGLGISAMFSGPPGTGKTMAAGLVARDLGSELYQVDTSKITSKWIGETEKNLAALFDAAEAGHAILLFDEADALFGKRTDVKSSNDRVANQETNYLLQRIETYSGICILTTNHEASIDEAFRRRLSVHVRFPLPETEERKHLWQVLIPTGAPTAGNLGIDALADAFVMSGGYIRNAVLRAAFLAADAGTPIASDHLLRAARLEYEAMGKVAPPLGGRPALSVTTRRA
jgi:DNA polymerase III delta prime subunit